MALGAKSPEDERVPFQPEAGLDFLRQRRSRNNFVREVHDEVAVPADEVAVIPGVDIVPGHLVERIDLDDQTRLAKHLQGLVHGVEGDGWHVPADFLVNLLGGGVIPASLQIS